MYFVTYDQDGVLLDIHTSIDQCQGAFGCMKISIASAKEIMTGKKCKWRMHLNNQELYKLPDVDPKYWTEINGWITKMTDDEIRALDAS